MLPFEWLYDATTSASQAVEGGTEVVVITEIGIGLCLIAGLFTFLAAAASAFMTVNFILSAMAGWDILWFTFGSIALMSGAGRTFGLDYYIMPWINNLVGNFWMGKRRPIYDIHGSKTPLVAKAK
ncbi:MAG: hypothetical protein RRZ84_06935 [Romboutsia sp.]